MAKFRMNDGSVVNTDVAKQSWDEDTYFDGRNHISKATGSQWDHETLYLSRKGRFYVVQSSQWQGSSDSAEYISEQDAVAWLLANGEDVPECLKSVAAEIEE